MCATQLVVPHDGVSHTVDVAVKLYCRFVIQLHTHKLLDNLNHTSCMCSMPHPKAHPTVTTHLATH